MSATLTATVLPEDAIDRTVTWSSSNAEVASVADGLVTAIKEGTASITVKAGEKNASCQVTVIDGNLQLTLSSTDAAILKAAGGESPAIVSASGNWTISSDASWLSISRAAPPMFPSLWAASPEPSIFCSEPMCLPAPRLPREK